MIAWLPLKSEAGESRRCKAKGSKAGNSQDNRAPFGTSVARLTSVICAKAKKSKAMLIDNGRLLPEKSKPIERWGRKTKGLKRKPRQPGCQSE